MYQLEGTDQPFVWGMIKGAIYLPANFAQTSTDHKRCSVLLHELAHVARLDPLVNLIQIVTQALYWFHPLVWAANRRIRAEREKCCDEIAIAEHNATPREYGSAIVDTLMQQHDSRMAVPTLAVAGPVRNIEDRIKTIMKPGRRFYSRPTFRAWIIVLVLGAALTPMAVALMPRTVDKAVSSATGKTGSSEYTARFPSGLTVELVGICQYPSKGRSWWRPDGTPLNLGIITRGRSTYASNDPAYEFVFRKTGDARFKIDSIRGCKTHSRLDLVAPEELRAYRVHVSSRYETTDVTLAVPSGAWKTVHASKSVDASTSGAVRGDTLILSAMISAGEDSLVSCTDELGYADASRIVVVDTAGRTHEGVLHTDTGVRGVRQRTIRYQKLPLSEVSEVKFQVCVYEYCTLRNVHLRKNADTGSQGEWKDRGPMIPGHSFQEMDLVEVLALMSDQVGIPIVADTGVLGVTSGSFDAVPLEVALDRVLAGTEYAWTKKEDYYLVSARVLSDEDRQKIEHLIQAYGRVPSAVDVEAIEPLFQFRDEEERQRFVYMMREEVASFGDSSTRATDKVYIMSIEPAGNNRLNVSALVPFQGRYMLRTTPCVRSDEGWKIGIDIQEVLDQAQQAKEFGSEELMRRESQAQLQMWENAQGQTLVTLCEDAKTQAQLRVQAMQFAGQKGLQMMPGSFTEEKYQQALEQIRAKSPENYQREMIAKYRRQLGPAEKYGKLEFRILYNAAASSEFQSDVENALEQRLRDRLRDNGPFDASAQGQSSIWLSLRHPAPNLVGAVIEEYQGQQYLLVSNEPNEIMTADGSWGLLAVYPQKDYMDKPAIGLELDQAGAEKLREITRHNIDRAMAIILDGRVLSAPTIASAIGQRALITGQFTEQEVRDMMVSLQKGMRPQSVDTPSQVF